MRVNVGRGIFDEYFGYFNENFELNWEISLVLKPNLRDVVTERCHRVLLDAALNTFKYFLISYKLIKGGSPDPTQYI